MRKEITINHFHAELYVSKVLLFFVYFVLSLFLVPLSRRPLLVLHKFN